MAKYSNPEIAAAYERGVQAGILKGPTLEPSGYANLLSTLGQNIAGMAKEAQKATTAEVTAILDGISKIEASAQAGVDAKAMDMWQNYQDNLTKLQTAAAQVDTVVLRKAAEEATNYAGESNVNNTQWRQKYLESIVTQLQDGSGRPFLYGTMQAAMSTLGYVDPNTGAITSGKMTEAVALIDSLEDPHLKGLAKSLFQNYTSQGTYYAGVESELQSLNEMLGLIQESGLSPEEWYKNNRAQWERFVHAHDQFRAKTLPYLTKKNGAFYASLEATIAPEMSGALAYQQGFYEGLTGGGTGGSTVSKDDLQYKLARYISSPAAQRTAADWGFNIGRIVPVKDEATKAEILRQFPTGVYFEDLGGIYVPGPDDRTMAKWAAKREDRSDPRGTLLEQAFGRHYRKETEYVDLTLKGPASSAGAKPTAEAAMPFQEGWKVQNIDDGTTSHIFRALGADGNTYWVQVDGLTKKAKVIPESEAVSILKNEKGSFVVTSLHSDMVKPENMLKHGFPAEFSSNIEGAPAAKTEPEKTPPTPGETLRNVQVVPARTGDPIGSITIIDPVTGEFRNISAEEVEDIVTVGGGGERQDLQTFMKRVRALRSQARGIEAANKSAATAAEHPESAAYSSTRATDAAEAFRSDETRGGRVWNEALKQWDVPTPLEPSKDEVPSMLAPEAEAKRAAEEAAAEQNKEKAAKEAIDQALKSGRQPAPAPLPGTPPPPKPTYYQLGNALYTFWPADPSDPASKDTYIVKDERGTRQATQEDIYAFQNGMLENMVKEVPAPAPTPVQPPAPPPLPESSNEREIPGRTTGSGADAQVAPPTSGRGFTTEPPARPPSAPPLDANKKDMDLSEEEKKKEREKIEKAAKEDEAKYSPTGFPPDAQITPLPGTPGEGKIEPLPPAKPGEGEITPMSGDKPEQQGKAESKPVDKRTASLKAFVSGYNRAPSSATVPPAGGNPGYPNAVKQVADTRYS